MPASLPEALDALLSDAALNASLGTTFVNCFDRIKRSEIERHTKAQNATEFERRAYFGRI